MDVYKNKLMNEDMHYEWTVDEKVALQKYILSN